MPLIAALISSKEICQALDVLHACGSGAATTVTYFPDGARMGAPCAFLLTLARIPPPACQLPDTGLAAH